MVPCRVLVCCVPGVRRQVNVQEVQEIGTGAFASNNVGCRITRHEIPLNT